MRREEAIDVVKEIGSSCKLLNPSEIDLEETSLVGHYEIRIEGSVDDENWQSLKVIAKNYGLGIKLTEKTLVIYKENEQDGNGLIEL
jgi:hypothetical protein